MLERVLTDEAVVIWDAMRLVDKPLKKDDPCLPLYQKACVCALITIASAALTLFAIDFLSFPLPPALLTFYLARRLHSHATAIVDQNTTEHFPMRGKSDPSSLRALALFAENKATLARLREVWEIPIPPPRPLFEISFAKEPSYVLINGPAATERKRSCCAYLEAAERSIFFGKVCATAAIALTFFRLLNPTYWVALSALGTGIGMLIGKSIGKTENFLNGAKEELDILLEDKRAVFPPSKHFTPFSGAGHRLGESATSRRDGA